MTKPPRVILFCIALFPKGAVTHLWRSSSQRELATAPVKLAITSFCGM